MFGRATPDPHAPARGTTEATRKPRLFYGWYVVAASFLANVAYTEQFSAAYGVFITYLTAEMGWGRTALAGVKTMARLVEAVLAPLVGALVDRYGARWIMVGGGVITSVAFLLASTLSEIWQLYLYFGFIGPVGSVCIGGFVTTVTVANWFVMRRGRAIGLTSMGISFGTMVLPVLTSAMIPAWGWRTSWLVLGIGVLFLLLPAAIFIRRRPEDLGMHPDGIAPDAAAAQPLQTSERERRRQEAAVAADVVWTRAEALRCPVLWILVFSWGFAQFAMASTTLHMVAFFADLGYPLMVGAIALSVRSAISIPGNVLWGMVIERMSSKIAAAIGFLITGMGLAMWVLPPSPLTLIAGIILFGIGGSGAHVASETIWADFFGRVSLGTVRGVAYPFSTFFAATGPLALGVFYDLTGSYQLGFAIMIVGCIASAALIQLARPPKPPGAARTAA
jgi:MFS family permease